MSIKINYINNILVFIYILLVFFIIPAANTKIVDILFVFFTAILILLTWYSKIKKRINIEFKIVDLIMYFLISIVYIIIVLVSEYSIIYITSNLLILICINYFFYHDNFIIKEGYLEKFYKCIYYLMCVSLIFQFFLSLKRTGSIASTIGWDKNYTGVILFLFFLFCYKRKYLFGIILSLIFSLSLHSRGYILMVALFFIIKLFKEPIYRVSRTFIFKSFFRIFVLMFLIIYLFSYFWVFTVATHNVVAYQQGLNDGSNKMRFVANIKAFNMIKENKKIILYGYDNDLKKTLGIDSDDYSRHPLYFGVRLVQTHNTILSIIIKTGILFAVLYLLIVSKILDKYYTKDNLEYLFPYLTCTMIMHSLLNTSFLLFWILVLHSPNKRLFNFSLFKERKILLKNKGIETSINRLEKINYEK